MIKTILSTISFLILSSHALSAMPTINKVSDQRTSQGSYYSFQPTLTSNAQVHWTKTFGPDDVSVNPLKGTVSWNIPANLPSESFHIGVKASNAEGESQETWIVTVGSGAVIYIGPNEDIKTLKSAMSAMNSGDTLVMRNGHWNHNNQANTIPGNEYKGQTLPGGSSSAFTTLMAEDPGQVILDGNDDEQLISLWGSTKHPDFPLDNNGSSRKTDYLAFKGLVLLDSRAEALRINYSKYIKLINIGVGPSSKSNGVYANVYIYRSRYVLIEGMYVWGHGRYKIQFKNSSESIVRRSLARIDNYIGGEPIGGYISYCSRNILFQNNILVDSDKSSYWGNHNEIINSYGVPATNCESYPEYNEFKRNLALNVHMGLMNTDARQNSNPSLWEDLVGWDLKPSRHSGGNGSVVPILSGVGATITNRMTLGEVDTEGSYYMYSREKDSTVKNSILYRVGWDGSDMDDQGDLIRRGSGGKFYFDTNNLVDFQGGMSDPGGVGSPVETGTMNINPQFKYLTMLPRSSALRSKGKDDGRLGAELMAMLGRSGTFYGQDGYDSEADVPMWPFPNQGLAHEHFGDFTHSGVDRNGNSAGIRGARGFAVAGQTLTNYVWSYLGETTPPFNLSAIPGDKQIKLVWSVSAPTEQANLKSYKIYQLVGGNKILKGGVAANIHSFNVTGLPNNTSADLVVTAVRNDDNESDYAYVASATPVEGPKPKAPILSID